MVIGYCLLVIVLSPFATLFLRSGQAANSVRPENKFGLPCAQKSIVLIDNAKVRNFHNPCKLIARNPTFLNPYFRANFAEKSEGL